MRLLKVYILLLELLFLNTLFQSCADEYIKTDVPQQDSEIMIQVKLPGTSSLEDTRGLTDQNENHLADLMVLAFDVNGNYLYKSEARLTEEGYGGNVRTCYVSLKKGECDLMFLANCKSILNSFTIPADATKDTFRNGLPVSLSGKWNAGSNYTPLPMWGEKNEVTILPNISFKDEEAVYLIRAIAKVDVTIDRDLVPTENLQLKSILFYHGASSSHIIPDEAVWDGVNHKVTGISSGSGSYTSKNQAMEYEESDLDTDGFLTNTIYVPETSAGSENALPVTPSLVIEADYNGEASWYRIDFLDEEKNFISLLRNYRYEVKITGVQGRGYADKNEAYTARSQNLEVEIFTYQDGSLTNIMYDGQYFLAWNPKEFEFSREARSESSTDNKLTLETNYEEGWKWTKTVDKNGNEVTWVRLAAEQQSGPKDKATTVSLLIDNPNQENTKSRIAYLHFTAGRMDMSVEVTQTDQTRAWIKILDALDNEVSGSTIWVNAVEGKVAEKLLFVEWGPIGAECSVSSEKALNGDMNVVYKDGNGITDGNLTDANGIHRYYLEFRPFDRSRDYNTTRAREITRYQTKYTFTVNYNNEVITRDIIIAHHFEMFDTDINEWYYLGFEWTASFYASTSYWISVNDDRTSPILYDASQLSGLNVILQDGETRRENVSFRLKNPTMERDNRKFQINVNFYTSKEMENFHIDVKGYKVLPNSYMVEKNGNVVIPVRKAWRTWGMYPLYKKLNEGGDFRCACLWEDKEGVISRAAFANGALHDIEISELIVFAGNTSGNAVIALYQDNQIIWTWHIWVTDYNPDGSGTTYTYDGNEFMDRNLGAASTTQSAESFGMMYQWGRKDPFPSFKHETSSGINATYDFLSNHKDIYNNTAEFAVKNNGPDLDYNLPLSIKEPMTFLTSDNDWCNGDDFPYRWALYKEGEHKMDHFKFEYDPCPDGWMAATALKDQDSPWTAGGIGDFWGDETFSKGILKANGDYMPATGYMHFKDAKYYQPWYWTSLPTIDYDKNSSGQVKGTMMRYYIRSSGTPNKGFVWTSPGEAMPVRCVKEVYFHPRYD